jgi:hypothetical protein
MYLTVKIYREPLKYVFKLIISQVGLLVITLSLHVYEVVKRVWNSFNKLLCLCYYINSNYYAPQIHAYENVSFHFKIFVENIRSGIERLAAMPECHSPDRSFHLRFEVEQGNGD